MRILLWVMVVVGTAHILIGVIFAVVAMGSGIALSDKLQTAWLSAAWGAVAAAAAMGLLYLRVLGEVVVEIVTACGSRKK